MRVHPTLHCLQSFTWEQALLGYTVAFTGNASCPDPAIFPRMCGTRQALFA